jgi:hypothetical protein
MTKTTHLADKHWNELMQYLSSNSSNLTVSGVYNHYFSYRFAQLLDGEKEVINLLKGEKNNVKTTNVFRIS